MFPNLNAEMARKSLNSKQLAKLAGIKYDTILNKLTGKTEFTRPEMYAIRDVISKSLTVDFLFTVEPHQTTA